MDFFLEEITFGFLQLQTCINQFLKDDFYVFKMFTFIPAKDDDVIQVCHHELTTILKNH